MNGMLPRLLAQFRERIIRKSFLRVMTRGWERRIGLIVEDQQVRFSLTIRSGEVEFGPWQEDTAYDLVVSGQERDLLLLFQGEELAYLHARKLVQTKGALRDQLKLDALLRLTADGAAI